MQRIIGIDFDNTIVCYDTVFHKIALEQQLIPASVSKNKEAVRNYLRLHGQEDAWTELQGYVYGARMRDATAFPGVIDFLQLAVAHQVKIYIISHKTMIPYRGPAYNLHESAMDWLDYYGFFEFDTARFSPQNVFFESSINLKLTRIAAQQCQYFIDDLPEVLGHQNFPVDIHKILFRPLVEVNDELFSKDSYTYADSWTNLAAYFFESQLCH